MTAPTAAQSDEPIPEMNDTYQEGSFSQEADRHQEEPGPVQGQADEESTAVTDKEPETMPETVPETLPEALPEAAEVQPEAMPGTLADEVVASGGGPQVRDKGEIRKHKLLCAAAVYVCCISHMK